MVECSSVQVPSHVVVIVRCLDFSGHLASKLRFATALRFSCCAHAAMTQDFMQDLEIAHNLANHKQSRKIMVLCAAKCITGNNTQMHEIFILHNFVSTCYIVFP